MSTESTTTVPMSRAPGADHPGMALLALVRAAASSPGAAATSASTRAEIESPGPGSISSPIPIASNIQMHTAHGTVPTLAALAFLVDAQVLDDDEPQDRDLDRDQDGSGDDVRDDAPDPEWTPEFAPDPHPSPEPECPAFPSLVHAASYVSDPSCELGLFVSIACMESGWALGLVQPTAWGRWLASYNAVDRPEAPAAPGTLAALPAAGTAGAGWNLSALGESGQPIGALEAAIEAGRMGDFEMIVLALDWHSHQVQLGTGDLVLRLLASASADASDGMLRAAALLMARGADLGSSARWEQAGSTFTYIEVGESMDWGVGSDIPKPQRRAWPLVLAMDSSLKTFAAPALSRWAEHHLSSLALARFERADDEGTQDTGAWPAGGGLLHACVLGKDDALLARLLEQGCAPLLSQVDLAGRTPLDFAVACDVPRCEEVIASYKLRGCAQGILETIVLRDGKPK